MTETIAIATEHIDKLPDVIKARAELTHALDTVRSLDEERTRAQHTLTQAEHDAVRSGKLDAKALREARQALVDLESTGRVVMDMADQARVTVDEVRRAAWERERDRLHADWVAALAVANAKIAEALTAITSLQSVECWATQVLGQDVLPSVGRTQVVPKLQWLSGLLAETVRKNGGR